MQTINGQCPVYDVATGVSRGQCTYVEGHGGRHSFEKRPTEEADLIGMAKAIAVAKLSQDSGLAPFGCIIATEDGASIGVGWSTGTERDPTAHSEVMAIKVACATRGLLHGCTIYSTHEPCALCCGAIVHAKLSRVVWGSSRADHPGLFRQRSFGPESILLDTTEPPAIVRGLASEDCDELLEEWTP